jgi:hypothetical protein
VLLIEKSVGRSSIDCLLLGKNGIKCGLIRDVVAL